MTDHPPFNRASLANTFELRFDESQAAPLDAEAQACAMIKQIASLYCTARGDCVKTTPEIYLNTDDKWGPYVFCLLARSESDDGGTYDNAIHKRLLLLAEHLEGSAGDHVMIMHPDTMITLTFSNIDGLIESCEALLKDAKCPGSFYEKAKILNHIPLIRGMVATERGASQSVTYHHAEDLFKTVPSEAPPEAEPEEQAGPYDTYFHYVSEALGMLISHCGERDGFDVNLRISLIPNDDAFLLMLRSLDHNDEPCNNPAFRSFMRNTFDMLSDVADLDDIEFHSHKNGFVIKIFEPEDGIVLLRGMLENLEETRLACVDDLEGALVWKATSQQKTEALKSAMDSDNNMLRFLPNSLPLSFESAALLQQEGFDAGVIPFSLKELEYLLLQAETQGRAPVPLKYQGLQRH